MEKEIQIPDGFEAKIEGNKVVFVPKESEGEKIRKALIDLIGVVDETYLNYYLPIPEPRNKMIAYLERRKEQPTNEEMLRTLRTEYEKGVADTIAKYEQKPTETSVYPHSLDEAIQLYYYTYGNGKGGFDYISLPKFQDIVEGLVKDFGQQPAEWSEDYREEDLQTRFAFYTYKDEDDVLYLSNVFVEETSRNKGLGTKILAAAEKVAETLGIFTIRLKAKQDSSANAWYRKHGYGYIGFEDGYDWLEKTLEYLKPIKQEWSDEDEEALDMCLDAIPKKWKTKSGILLTQWLKDNIHLQPKQERSEEDYNAILIAIDWLQYYRDTFVSTEEAKNEITACISRLTSIRPQPHWKPSEEQMRALDNAQGELCGTEYNEGLCSLIDDLKKLKI